jgi:hypothetical protein
MKKFPIKDLSMLILKVLGVAFLGGILYWGFYFLGYLWKLILN